MKIFVMVFMIALGSFASGYEALQGHWVCLVQNSSDPHRPDRMDISLAEPLVTLKGWRKNSSGKWEEKNYALATETTLLSSRFPRKDCSLERQDLEKLAEFNMRCGKAGASLQIDASNNVGAYGEVNPPRIKLHYILENCQKISDL